MNILVAGVAFTDIKGFPFAKYDPVGTNKGSVVITHGGVSRNVAEDLANLGANVEFLTMLDDSPLGEDVKLRLEAAGVSLQYAVSVPGGGIGMWLAVFDESGNLAGSISKMPDVLPLEKALQDAGDMLVQSADAVVVEYDTSEEIALLSCSLARKYNKPLYVIVGNMSVILARSDLMRACDCAIMNDIEAGKLFETSLDLPEKNDIAEQVLSCGRRLELKRAIITLGARGCVYADYTQNSVGWVDSVPCEVVDTTGAGDSFFSAAVISLSRGQSLRQACLNGARVAAGVVSSKQSACSRESRALLEM